MAKKSSVKIPVAKKARTKSEISNIVAEITGLTRKDVVGVIDAVGVLIQMDLSKKGPQAFAIPGICKFTTKVRPASPERPGRNPFTGEDIVIKAKPARTVVKIRPLKNLKDAVE